MHATSTTLTTKSLDTFQKIWWPWSDIQSLGEVETIQNEFMFNLCHFCRFVSFYNYIREEEQRDKWNGKIFRSYYHRNGSKTQGKWDSFEAWQGQDINECIIENQLECNISFGNFANNFITLVWKTNVICIHEQLGISIRTCAAAYQLGNTSSRTITEVKQPWAWLVLGWDLFKCCLSAAANP